MADLQKLQVQHNMEKNAIKEQFEFIYNKYKEKKDSYKQLQKQLEKEQKHRENQRKIYERLFTEGFKLEDVRKVMDRYMQKEAEKVDVKAKTSALKNQPLFAGSI